MNKSSYRESELRFQVTLYVHRHRYVLAMPIGGCLVQQRAQQGLNKELIKTFLDAMCCTVPVNCCVFEKAKISRYI